VKKVRGRSEKKGRGKRVRREKNTVLLRGKEGEVGENRGEGKSQKRGRFPWGKKDNGTIQKRNPNTFRYTRKRARWREQPERKKRNRREGAQDLREKAVKSIEWRTTKGKKPRKMKFYGRSRGGKQVNFKTSQASGKKKKNLQGRRGKREGATCGGRKESAGCRNRTDVKKKDVKP